MFYKGYYSTHKWAIACALFISGAFLLLLGKYLVRDKVRILIDPKTGEEVRLEDKHSFFWIRVTRWAPILWTLGVWCLIS